MVEKSSPKTLVVSSRELNSNLAASSFYEFEDLICNWMGADIISPCDAKIDIRRKLETAAYQFTRSERVANIFATSRFAHYTLEQEYDLGFAVFPSMDLTYKLHDIKNLRENCKVLAAYVPEVWVKNLESSPHRIAPLAQCDYIFVSTIHSVETVARLTGRPCAMLNFGVDALKFSPHPFYPTRSIDVLNIGRRSAGTHEALLEQSKTSDFFYVYDTVNSTKAINAVEHRLYYANAAKRAKFYIANTANFNEAWKTGPAIEIGHRFYEGAAAGCVLVGACPDDHPVIVSDFDWLDAIVKCNYDAPDIMELLNDLERDVDRTEAIRSSNIVNSALRHDFVHRWSFVLNRLGYSDTPKMQERRLALADIVDGASSSAGQSLARLG